MQLSGAWLQLARNRSATLSLKALARKVLDRNSPCNTHATGRATSEQISGPGVAQIAASNAVFERVCPKWDSETAPLIDWFLATPPRREPFQLYPGVFIARPEHYWDYLSGDIAAGPDKGRAATGALQKDLRRLAELLGHVEDLLVKPTRSRPQP